MRFILLCGLFLCAPQLFAQIGLPLPVEYRCAHKGDELGSIQGITWGEEKDRWRADFHFPEGWFASEFWKGAWPHIELEITASDGAHQRTKLDLRRFEYHFEELNGEFNELMSWQKPYWVGEGSRDIYYAEKTDLGPWRVQRVIWRVGGCSGNPPMLFLMVVQHQPTGLWSFQLAEFSHPPVADRGDAMRLHLSAEDVLEVSWWNAATRNTAVMEGWRFALEKGSLVLRDLPRSYRLDTRNGAVTAKADSPAEALHLGYQEVAWALDSSDQRGGVARAYAESPRRFETDGDRYKAPLLPSPGTMTFRWAAELYVVPWQARPLRLPLAKALPLLKTGRWDVVLFRNAKGTVLAMRLVEHHQDFPHSTAIR